MFRNKPLWVYHTCTFITVGRWAHQRFPHRTNAFLTEYFQVIFPLEKVEVLWFLLDDIITHALWDRHYRFLNFEPCHLFVPTHEPKLSVPLLSIKNMITVFLKWSSWPHSFSQESDTTILCLPSNTFFFKQTRWSLESVNCAHAG